MDTDLPQSRPQRQREFLTLSAQKEFNFTQKQSVPAPAITFFFAPQLID